jgi:hypothetical protein
MQMRDGLDGGISHAAAVIAPGVFCAGLEEREIVLENILDPQEDIPEPRALHQGRQRRTMLGQRRRHRLNEILDVIEPGIDDGLAQQREASYVERNVVIDQKDRPSAVAAGVRNVGKHPLDWKHVKVPAAHFDDRAEAAVERAAPRRFDDVNLTPHERVAIEDTCCAVWQAEWVGFEIGDRSIRPMKQSSRCSVGQAGNWVYGPARIERAKQFAQCVLSFAADKKIDFGTRVIRTRCKAWIVPPCDNAGHRSKILDESRDFECGFALKGHDR